MATSQSAHGPDPSFWHGRRVLLTGHTGFKGGWAALWLHRLGARVGGLALPPGQPSLFDLARIGDLLESHIVDIRDTAAVADVIARTEPQLVLHLAAQPLVRRALVEPVESFTVNLLGTINLLQSLRPLSDLSAVLIVTSDKVYANGDRSRPHVESDPLGGDEPYAASKAAAEIATVAMARCYLAENGVAVATARAGNVIGGGDFAEDRLVPDAVRAVLSRQTLTLRHPGATRPWQHVLDCISGYLVYLEALAGGQTVPAALNFGPRLRSRATVAQLAMSMLEALGAKPDWLFIQEQQSREAQSLALDSRLARQSLAWTDKLVDKQMISVTANWYRAWARGEDMRAVTVRQIRDYEAMP